VYYVVMPELKSKVVVVGVILPNWLRVCLRKVREASSVGAIIPD
jgi:hypothetical protein